MRLLLRHITLIICLISLLATSCNNRNTSEQEEQTQTIIFYFAGTSLTFYYYKNISAIKEALRKDIKGNSRVMLFFQQGEKKSAEIIELTYNNGACEEQKLDIHTLPQQMDADNLSHYLKEIMRHAPADTYSLIIGSHGTGWIPIGAQPHDTEGWRSRELSMQNYWQRTGDEMTRYIGEDGNLQNAFDIPTLAQAIEKTGVKFEYILFDACFMANVESAYELRNSTRYIIGSVCEIMGSGFPYNTVLPEMLTNGGRGYNLDGICRAFNSFYKENYGYSGSIATIDCSQLDALATVMKQINAGAKKSYDINSLQFYEGQYDHIFFDLGDYVEKMCGSTTLKDDFNRQMDKTIIHKYTLDSYYSAYGKSGKYDITSFSGINTSAPAKVYVNDYKQTAWYKATN